MTTLLAPTPFVGEEVERLRRDHDWPAALGVAAHVTLLGPFLHPAAVTSAVLTRLRDLLGGHGPFRLDLSSVHLLADSACLIPGNPEPLRVLSRLLHAGWPQVEPHGGIHHVTVARGLDAPGFEAMRQQIEPLLPRAGVVSEILLLERRDEVRTLARFPL